MARKAMDQTAEVMRLHYLEGLSLRAIGRRLHMARKTIRRILDRSVPRTTAVIGRPRGSMLDSYDATIRQLLEETPELQAPAVLERLRACGYTGGISILRDRIRKLRPAPRAEAFLTIEYAPGGAMQVD